MMARICSWFVSHEDFRAQLVDFEHHGESSSQFMFRRRRMLWSSSVQCEKTLLSTRSSHVASWFLTESVCKILK